MTRVTIITIVNFTLLFSYLHCLHSRQLPYISIDAVVQCIRPIWLQTASLDTLNSK